MQEFANELLKPGEVVKKQGHTARNRKLPQTMMKTLRAGERLQDCRSRRETEEEKKDLTGKATREPWLLGNYALPLPGVRTMNA